MDAGVIPTHIIEIQLDDRVNKELRDPDNCLAYIMRRVKDDKPYYLLIDEVQLMAEFEDVLNSCLHISNLDTYVTGSNSRFLSTDIITEFRGRGDEIYLRPLNFSEFATTCPALDFDAAWLQYITYGGLPYCALLPTTEERAGYLTRLFEEVYVRDIMERHNIKHPNQMEQLMNIISSGIGSLTNPKKLENAFVSMGGEKMSFTTSCAEEGFPSMWEWSKSTRDNLTGNMRGSNWRLTSYATKQTSASTSSRCSPSRPLRKDSKRKGHSHPWTIPSAR